MGKYHLNIDFNEKDLKTICNAEEKVIIVKHTKAKTGEKVAWVSFQPFMHNTIDWETSFSVYSSNTEVQDGSTISKLSDKDAATENINNFKEGNFTDATPNSAILENTYKIKNNMEEYDTLTFGLAQDVSVNGETFTSNPINAVSVPFGQSVNMTPIERIDVYLLNDIEDGTVLSKITSVPLRVEYSDLETSHTIAYDGSVGKFYPVK